MTCSKLLCFYTKFIGGHRFCEQIRKRTNFFIQKKTNIERMTWIVQSFFEQTFLKQHCFLLKERFVHQEKNVIFKSKKKLFSAGLGFITRIKKEKVWVSLYLGQITKNNVLQYFLINLYFFSVQRFINPMDNCIIR